jgi:monoamine oxidase
MDSTDFGETIRMAGGYSAAAEYFWTDETDEMDMKIACGNIELVRALEGAVVSRKGKILTESHVTAIDQPKSGERVVVWTAKGDKHFASYCICTVPARILTKIQFDPRLPDDQWDAAKQLQYARIMKTAILCESRFWMDRPDTKFSCFTDSTSDFLFDATLGQKGVKGILCSYAIGDKADDLNSYEEPTLKRKLRNNLNNIFPNAPVEILAIQKQAWQENELTQGAYAFYRPGQWFTVREILSRPHDRVYFAGEHIAEDQGFMEGAVDTGEEAAEDILRGRAGVGRRRKPRKIK